MREIRTEVSATVPVLSVLVPFYRDDPVDTMVRVAALAGPEVEILLWDDGTRDADLTARVEAALLGLDADVRVTSCAENRGRSEARNALFARARGAWVLFLDADMRPGDDRFLERYMDAIREDAGDVLFGGFTVEDTGPRATELHREMARRSDCAPAAERAEHGPQHVASSNLCVRRDVLVAEPFDGGFSGWGWEDSEWAARVGRTHRVVHLDNPAVHLGLETEATLLRRFANSGPNYKRFADSHPEFARGLPLFRHARRLSRVPGQRLARPLLKLGVRARFLPVGLRVLALKLWRASHYADVVA